VASLAEYDATAALILGQRMHDANLRLGYYLRAAALSGKSGPIMALAEKRYSSTARIEYIEGKRVRIPLTEDLIARLTLETIAERMGDPRANLAKWRKEIENQDGLDIENALQRPAAFRKDWLIEMRNIQRSITGSSQLEGMLDA